MDGVHACERDVSSQALAGPRFLRSDRIADRLGVSVQRPAFENAQAGQIHLAAFRQFHDLLTSGFLHRSRWDPEQGKEFLRLGDQLSQVSGWLWFGE